MFMMVAATSRATVTLRDAKERRCGTCALLVPILIGTRLSNTFAEPLVGILVVVLVFPALLLCRAPRPLLARPRPRAPESLASVVLRSC